MRLFKWMAKYPSLETINTVSGFFYEYTVTELNTSTIILLIVCYWAQVLVLGLKHFLDSLMNTSCKEAC